METAFTQKQMPKIDVRLIPCASCGKLCDPRELDKNQDCEYCVHGNKQEVRKFKVPKFKVIKKV